MRKNDRVQYCTWTMPILCVSVLFSVKSFGFARFMHQIAQFLRLFMSIIGKNRIVIRKQMNKLIDVVHQRL